MLKDEKEEISLLCRKRGVKETIKGSQVRENNM